MFGGIEDIVMHAQYVLATNQECFMAQWILQNPDKNVFDYVLVHQPDWITGEQRVWMERKKVYE